MHVDEVMRCVPAAFLILLATAGGVLAEEAGGGVTAVDFNLYMQGKYVYERNCIVCHGPRGDGNGELSATLKPKPRSFREGMFKFRTTPYGMLPTDEDLRRTIKHGLSGTAMGMFNQLQAEEVEAVIAYVKSFSRRWKKKENYAPAMKLAVVPEWFKAPGEVKAHALKGQGLFMLNCAACHGEKADGNGAAAISLKDMWGSAAAPSDLRQAHPRCGDAPEDLFRVMATGLNGTPMVSFEKVLSEAQRWDIVAYLLSIRLPSGPVL